MVPHYYLLLSLVPLQQLLASVSEESVFAVSGEVEVDLLQNALEFRQQFQKYKQDS